MAIAEPIMDAYAWLCLPRWLQDAVRRAWCIDGHDSEAYRLAVAAARKWWEDHPLPEPKGR